MKKIALLIAIPLFLMACATAERGQRFDTSQANQVVIGKTTEADVLGSLGQPYRTQTRSNGEKVFVYAHVEANASLVGVKSKIEKFTILFDKAGTVQAIDKTGI